MFVKKFEAPSLEDALKLIKTEMGPEALILSTQEKRSGKLFSRRLVEVTAACEKKQPSKSTKSKTYSAQLSKTPLEEVFPQQDVKSKTKPAKYIEIDSHNLDKAEKNYVVRQQNELSKFEAGFKTLGISEDRALDLSKKMNSDFSKSDLSDPDLLYKAKVKLLSQGVRTLTPAEFFKKRSWVPVGVAGAGKTTLLVKLALAAKDYEKSVSLISLDSRKFSGRSELAGYAKLIKVPFFCEINQSNAEKMRLIDSPALSLNGESNSLLEKACVERSPLLVLDASSRFSELMRQVDYAMKFHPEAICFTKCDNVEERGVIYDVLKSTQLPLVGLSLSSSFKTKFKFLTPVELAAYIAKD
ncbi:MAG: hypothetical protein EBR01_09325 [Proteobacteria bacterium]|nr:hypothetical protein [Pseudomonadota bacterium]